MNKNNSNINKLLNVTLILYFAVLVILLSLSQLAGEDDLFWYLSTGRYILENGVVPSYDVFGFTTSGMPWIPFEWAWDVINIGIFSFGGFAALSVLEILLVLFVFYLIYRMHLKFKVHYSVSIIILFLLSAGMVQRMSVKPHLISYIALLLLLWLFIRYRYFEHNVKILYFIPLVFLVWINFHMGVIGGFLLFGIFILNEILEVVFRPARKTEKPGYRNIFVLLIIFFVSIAVTLINPHGIKTYEYAFHIVSMKQLEIIYEWKSPFSREYLLQFNNFIYYIFILLILPVVLYSIRKRDYFPLLLTAGFFINSTRTYRFTVDFMLVTSVFAALSLNFFLQESGKKSARMAFIDKPPLKVVLSVILLLVIANVPNNNIYTWLSYPRKFGYGIDANNFPVGMYDFMKKNGIAETGERPFNTYETGGYFVWNFPGRKNFIGSRGLNDDVWNQYVSIINTEPGFEGKIDILDFDYVLWTIPLVNYAKNPGMLNIGALRYFFKDNKKWKLIYWDDNSFLFVRNGDKFSRIISEKEYKYINPYDFYFRRSLIEKAINENKESVKHELLRKKHEDPDGLFLKAIQDQFGKVLE